MLVCRLFVGVWLLYCFACLLVFADCLVLFVGCFVVVCYCLLLLWLFVGVDYWFGFWVGFGFWVVWLIC